MGTVIKELVQRGHDMAAELNASCGAVDVRSVAKLISELASQLDVQLVRGNQIQQQLAAVVAENAGLKQAAEFATAPDMWVEQADGMLDYRYVDWYVDVLQAAMQTPATDAHLAEVRAQARNEGINYAASRLAAAYNHGFVDKPLSEVYDVVRMILTAKEDLVNDPAADGLSGEYAENSLIEFAAQLRQGAGQ